MDSKDTIEIVDDFLPLEKFAEVQKVFLSNNFPWSWCEDTVKYPEDKQELLKIPEEVRPKIICEEEDNYQLQNIMYVDCVPLNEYFQYVSPVLALLRPKAIGLCRVKVNLNPRTQERVYHGMHTDTYFTSRTAVYYLNTNDGITLFETGQEVKSVSNRIVFFPSHIKHTGTTCTDQKRRVVLNINYLCDDGDRGKYYT